MQHQIDYIGGVRQTILRAVRSFNNKQLNEIPLGFHNNLIWHMGHIIASQQDIFYLPSGFEMKMTPEMYFKFRIGTSPTKPVSDEDIETIKSLLLMSVSDLQADYEAGLFDGMAQYEELLTHFIFHEGMHLAYILSIRRLLVYLK